MKNVSNNQLFANSIYFFELIYPVARVCNEFDHDCIDVVYMMHND